jgi:DNA-binding transcriptional LysR family regulator
MELRHLRCFVAVGEEQHYGRAAERLRVAQPALSRQIQDLEKEVGFKLFDRLPRGVKISAAGKSLLNDARATFFRRSTMQQHAQNALLRGNQAH